MKSDSSSSAGGSRFTEGMSAGEGLRGSISVLLARLSCWLAPVPAWFAIPQKIGKDVQAEFERRAGNYFQSLARAQVIYRDEDGTYGNIELQYGKVTGRRPGSALRMLLHLCLGRILSFRLRGRLQQLFPQKFYVIAWDDAYRFGAWRFAAAGAVRPYDGSFRETPTGGDAVVLLGTGPSAENVFDDAYADLPIIACNTSIKSRRLLERNIFALCVLDAAFFMGSSKYSEAFRGALREAFQIRKFRIYFDAEHSGIIRGTLRGLDYEEWLRPIWVASHFRLAETFRHGRFQNAAAGNIFTQAMLPVGATHFQKLKLIGFDGKSKDVNYFWKHSDEFQFQDLLPTVRECEPGFFAKVDFDAYSAKHNDVLKTELSAIEAAGVEIEMTHRTFIPELALRYKGE